MQRGRFYEEMDAKMDCAAKEYEAASMENEYCLLAMFRHVNALRKQKHKGMEAAICWLNFLRIPLNETQAFYQNILHCQINQFLKDKMKNFAAFGMNHRPSFCRNGLLFPYLIKKSAFFHIETEKLIQITKYCLTEWMRAISRIFDLTLLQKF